VGIFHGPVSPNPDEVQAYRWAEFDELHQTTDASYAPWFRLMMHDQTLIKQLESSRKDLYV
jgi:isopentenyldiphosphate isomerase